MNARCIGGQQAHEDAQAGECRGETNGPGRHAQHNALRQQLLNEPAARSAQRAANGDFAFARGGAGEHEVGNVGAGDEQDEADRAEEQQQARAHGSGFRFEQRHDGHVRGPVCRACARETGQKDVVQAAQLGLRLARA